MDMSNCLELTDHSIIVKLSFFCRLAYLLIAVLVGAFCLSAMTPAMNPHNMCHS